MSFKGLFLLIEFSVHYVLYFLCLFVFVVVLKLNARHFECDVLVLDIFAFVENILEFSMGCS